MSTEDIDNEEFEDNSGEEIENGELLEDENLTDSEGNIKEHKYDKLIADGDKKYLLTGMYKDWYLDYASEVILERAVPHIIDGLKPVQRRILHAMKLQDDGRLNKVASLVGATMPFHPHGDISIKDALVQIGQKDLLIVCQGNWGNLLTGDKAAAGRYIEAKLSEFANEVVFNSKTTEWVNSYDGRNKEPVNLPVKFPLLLAQGSEGIAVGLACKVLPHNFNELIDASISYLKGEDFVLYPDFPTGGIADVSKYNNGKRGGKVRIRANITKLSRNSLAITEIPFGKTTTDIINSIIAANDKGQIKVKKIDDNTAEHVEIVLYLQNDVSPDKTIDALYSFTYCEVSISPNTCVIKDKKPQFIGVEEILRFNTDTTVALLKKELEIKLAELEQDWHYTSLEKIFFENKVYKVLENEARTWEKQLADTLAEMKKYQELLRAPITPADINRLVEKPVRKISRFDLKAVNEKIKGIEAKEKEVQNHLDHLIDYAIEYYTGLQSKYGARFPRKTQLSSFESIRKGLVAANNAKLYVNRAEGFVGISPKKIDNAEFVCECSDLDQIIVFVKDGRYMVRKVDDKCFFDKNILHVAIYNPQDSRTTYNIIYRDGKAGIVYAKRFIAKGLSKDRWYNTTTGKEGSVILWFTSNHDGEAETVRVYLRPRPKLKKLIFDYDFAELGIKNKSARGNIVSKNPIQKITLKSAGVSTIGGKPIWFDWDVLRLNEDSRGELIGEFVEQDRILAVCKEGKFYTTTWDLSSRFQGEVMKIEKLDPKKVYSAIYWDGAQKCFYIKRFCFEASDNTEQLFIADDSGSYLHSISEDEYPQIRMTFSDAGKKAKTSELIDVEEFIGIKSFRAKGKKATYNEVKTIEFIEPLVKEGPTNTEITLDNEDFTSEENGDSEAVADATVKEVTPTEPVDTKKNLQTSFSPGTVINFDIDDDDDLTLF